MGLMMRHRLRVLRGILLSIAATASVAVLNIGSSQAVLAADIPTKAPVLKAPASVATNWTGFYLNGGGGYGLWSAESYTSGGYSGIPTLPLVQTQGGAGWV